jgi:hypothetical protein
MCPTHKKSFATELQAEDALISAWTTYNYSLPNAPIAVYRCDDCGEYHFTSKGEVNKRLSAMLSSGQIKKIKDADQWLDRIKRKGKFR